MALDRRMSQESAFQSTERTSLQHKGCKPKACKGQADKTNELNKSGGGCVVYTVHSLSERAAPQLLATEASKVSIFPATAMVQWRTMDFKSGWRGPVSQFYQSLAAWPHVSLNLSRPLLHSDYRMSVNIQGKVPRMWWCVRVCTYKGYIDYM